MVVAVTFGILLAALLFMRRMAEVSGGEVAEASHPLVVEGLPKDVLVYEVAGPLFFGAAQKAMSALQRVAQGVAVVILDLQSVPAIDATGLVALESAIDRLYRMNVFVVLAGVQHQPLEVLGKAGFPRRTERLAVCRSYESALATARKRSKLGEGKSQELAP